MNGFESSLLESGSLLRKSVNGLLSNFGKAVALFTIAIAVLVTFTDVTFSDVTTERFGAEMLLMLVSIYVIYFSMEDAGEKLGEESSEMQTAKQTFTERKAKIDMTMLGELRAFCDRYVKEELAYRRRALLLSFGLSDDMPAEKSPPRDKRRYRRAGRKKPIRLSPADLLSGTRQKSQAGVKNPAVFKLPHLLLKLLPTTVCTVVTVSVMLTAKEGLTAGVILSGLLRLSTLPVVAFRGYAEGYRYVTESVAPWYETKAMLLDCFLKNRGTGDT